eukprot:TRINITY_DN12400_c0_g1_i9.p1 TRINITY_DN12400_c0_g1~~TRINITY_DN12400_c0_g1_i9.p1  ORF type:complete len:730 (-),score=214.24 TRINITY_DN12400_c0_g1_i9:297-2429(-)
MAYGDLMGVKARGILSNSGDLVDVSSITKVASDDLGLLPQPKKPIFKTALAQIYVRSQPYGGSDKSSNGHRYDSIPFANGMINAGMSCQLIHYTHEEHDQFFEVCKNFDAIIVRCNPGQIKADGGSQEKFDNGMRAMRKLGIQVWPSPDVMEFMGAKDALCKVANLNIGLEDTLAYYTPEDFATGFKKTMAFQPRVLKQNRGSSGEGIWIIKLKANNYCSTYGQRSCEDNEVLSMMEANDNHAEEHTVAEVIEFCVNGRTAKSGTWTSKGVGKYLEGGKAAGGQLVDQRFCPRIVEGELRYNMVGDALVGIIHKKPKDGGISAVGGTGSIYTFYGPEEPKFMNLSDNFLNRDLSKVMPALGLAQEPLPLWWTTDFILASPEGTPAEQEKWIVGEFNCSCVGISKCLSAYCKDDTPNACFTDIPAGDLKEAMAYGNLMGVKALGILKKAGVATGAGAAARTPGVMKIVFLRHGESDWNVKNIFTGWADVDLSENGKQEAVEAGKMLKENGFKFDIVFTSVLRRAIRTAWTALMHSDNFAMPVINSWRLNERHYGGLQGLNKAETAAKHGEAQVKIWRRSYDTPPPAIDMSDARHPANDPLYRHVPKAALPGAESLALTVDRVLPFWNDAIAPCVMAGKTVLVAAHGNSLRAICKHLEGMSNEDVMELNIPTGVPLVYELSTDLKVLKKYYLMDDAAVQAKLAAVANQGKAK